jgi:transporter family-2 protein
VTDEAAPAITVALAAGILGAIQPKINAVLGSRLGSALLASLVNFTVALVLVAVAVSLRPATRRRLVGLRAWDVPRWTFIAGLGGAVVVLAGAVTVETIGVAIFSVAFFAGQITFSLVVDRLGLGPGGKRPVSVQRVQAVILAVVAVAVAQIGRDAGELAPALVAFVVAAGAAVSFQSAFNARIAFAIGDPVAATALNVGVGIVTLATVVLAVAGAGDLQSPRWPGEPWLYAGGALGVTIVLALAISTAALGVLRATLAMLAAQLIAAFAVDWVVEGDAPAAGVIAGSALIVASVALVGRQAPRPPTQASSAA